MKKEIIDAIELAKEVSQLSDVENVKEHTSPQIDRLIAKNDDQLKMVAERLQNSEIEEIAKQFANFDIEKGYNRLNNRIKRSRKRKLISVISVASALIVLSLVIYNYQPTKQEVAAEYPQHTIIEKEYTKPTLKLTELEEIVFHDKLKSITSSQYIKREIESKTESKAESKAEERELIIPSGYIYTIFLEDGTEVTLNAMSKLRFVDGTREVTLEGEAYFDVAPSKEPFTVNTKGATVKVYGTAFNVKEFQNGKFETTLVSGKVGVNINKREYMLKPNEMLVNDSGEIDIKEVNALQYIKWREGYFDYYSYPLANILDDVAKWYNIQIDCNIDISNIKISLFASKDSNLNDIIDLIESYGGLMFTKKNKDNYELK